MREAARGGGLFFGSRTTRGSGDRVAAQLAPNVTAAPIKRNSALGDHPLSLDRCPVNDLANDPTFRDIASRYRVLRILPDAGPASAQAQARGRLWLVAHPIRRQPH